MTPRVRSLILRSFVAPSSYPGLPLLLSTTDIRAPKVSQVISPSTDSNNIEAVFWAELTQEQFRITGRMFLVPAPSYTPSPHFPSPPAQGESLVFDALRKEGLDWQRTRIDTFDGLSGYMKASWCRAIPGTPMVGGYDEALQWPEELPKLHEASDDEDKKNLQIALANFALVIIEPLQVNFVELATKPQKKTIYRRQPDQSEFTETIVVP
ncbi:hypothetical protein ID866_8924 [Astraeus odoratus]|nr:hypothetical protein ID866_8924 [Astraeus odoratus]